MLLYIAGTLAVISFIALAVSPVIGIALMFISKPFIDTQFEHSIVGGLKLTELVAAGVPIVVLIHMVFAGGDKAFSRMPLRWIWLIFIGDVLLFSSIIAYQQDLPTGANVFFRNLNGFMAFYMVQAFFHEERRLKFFLIALMVAGLFPVGVGVYQAVTGVVWKAEQSEGLARNIGLWHDSVNIREYAAQSIMALLLYGALYIKRSSIPLKVTMLSYLSLAVLVIAKTYSKAGYLSLAIWAVCWTLVQKRYRLLALIAVGGIVAVIVYGGDFVGNVYQMFHKEIGFFGGQITGEHTFAGRWYGWEEMITKWEKFDGLSQTFGSGQAALGAHNDYLLFLYHGGIIGLGVYLALLASIGVRIAKNLRLRADPMAVAALMLFLMWMADTIGLVPSGYPSYQWFIWGLIGLSLRMREIENLEMRKADLIVSRDDTAGSSTERVPSAIGRRYPLPSHWRRRHA